MACRMLDRLPLIWQWRHRVSKAQVWKGWQLIFAVFGVFVVFYSVFEEKSEVNLK